jgi:hypothetical protein
MTLYLTDLDGTLLNYAAKLKPRAAEMLNRAISKGVLFSYATARGFITSRRITAELKLNLPIITMNGAIIYDPVAEKVLQSRILGAKSCELMSDFIKEHNETPLVYAFIDGEERISYLESDTKKNQNYLKDRKGDVRLRPCKSHGDLFAGEVFYLSAINPASSLDALKTAFCAENGFAHVCYENVYHKSETLFELFNAGVSKAAATFELKKLAGVDKIIAFGDNLNDIPMFEAADECYAVENAVTELKALATGIIPSNENMGVPVFIEKHITKKWDYTSPENVPDKARFAKAINGTTESPSPTIGILNEKPIHAALKNYFSSDPDREAKIGNYYADAAGEHGVFEIQTANWGALKKKLDVFLDACHVTVVYPFEQRVHNISINEQTGEFIKKSPARNNKNLTKFFLELYRIKGFLTHPNLTVCLAGLEIEKINKKTKRPLALLSEIHLNCGADFFAFLPDDLPETFTKKEFSRHVKNCEASIMLEILEYLCVVRKVGKKSNEFIFSCRSV